MEITTNNSGIPVDKFSGSHNYTAGNQSRVVPDIKLDYHLEVALRTMHLLNCCYEDLDPRIKPEDCRPFTDDDNKVIKNDGVPKELFDLGLVCYESDGNAYLTDKAKSVVEQGSFIIKYPLSDERGVVANYNTTVKTMSGDALNALVLAMMHEDCFKRISKNVNGLLLQQMQACEDYYRSKIPQTVARLTKYKQDIDNSTARYEAVLMTELAAISNFTLPTPILKFVPNDTGNPVYITHVINDTRFKLSNGKVLDLDQPGSYLSQEEKFQIIKQYCEYTYKLSLNKQV